MVGVIVVEQEQASAVTVRPTAFDDSAELIVRPRLPRWIWYALGGRLPRRHRGWVLHDTTVRTWWLRHIARMLVQLAIPVVLIMLLLPAPVGLRAACAGAGLFLGLFYSLAYMPESIENRVVQAGYPAGTATARREDMALQREQRDNVRRRAAAASRAARYRDRMGR